MSLLPTQLELISAMVDATFESFTATVIDLNSSSLFMWLFSGNHCNEMESEVGRFLKIQLLTESPENVNHINPRCSETDRKKSWKTV